MDISAKNLNKVCKILQREFPVITYETAKNIAIEIIVNIEQEPEPNLYQGKIDRHEMGG